MLSRLKLLLPNAEKTIERVERIVEKGVVQAKAFLLSVRFFAYNGI